MTRHFKIYWLPVLLWILLIFSISSIGKFPTTLTPLLSVDKLWHVLEYAVLAFLLARALKNSDNIRLRNNFRLLAILFAVVYAFSDELRQHFIPTRTGSIADFIADAIGAVLGQFFYRK